MKIKDRAMMVVTELEAKGSELGFVSPEMIVSAIERNSLGDQDAEKLHFAVRELMHSRGYDVARPELEPRVAARWALLGLLILIAWLGFWILVTSVI